LSPALEQVVLTALSHARERRFPGVQQMADALAACPEAEATAAELSLFVRTMMQTQLQSEGRHLAAPADANAYLRRWRERLQPDPSLLTKDDRDTAALDLPDLPELEPRTFAEPLGKSIELTPTDKEPDPRLRKHPAGPPARRVLLYLAPVLGALLAAALALWVRQGTFAVDLTSSPSAAEVLVDGVPAGARTPLRISNLEAGTPHRIELRVPGRRVFSRVVEGKKGDALKLHGTLEPAAAAPAATTGQ
jgi:hypothetical protein